MKKKINNKLIKQAKELIDSTLGNYPNHYSRREIVDRIRADRELLKAIAQCVKVNNHTFESKLSKKLEFRTFISKGNYFKIIDINDSEDCKTTDVSRLYANLEVINTIIIDDDDVYLTNNMAIRLFKFPYIEVWLYESELSELYK